MLAYNRTLSLNDMDYRDPDMGGMQPQNSMIPNPWDQIYAWIYFLNILISNTAEVQPRLIQGIRRGDGVGDLFIYLFIQRYKE